MVLNGWIYSNEGISLPLGPASRLSITRPLKPTCPDYVVTIAPPFTCTTSPVAKEESLLAR